MFTLSGTKTKISLNFTNDPIFSLFRRVKKENDLNNTDKGKAYNSMVVGE